VPFKLLRHLGDHEFGLAVVKLTMYFRLRSQSNVSFALEDLILSVIIKVFGTADEAELLSRAGSMKEG
jgi:hypothetical protein